MKSIFFSLIICLLTISCNNQTKKEPVVNAIEKKEPSKLEAVFLHETLDLTHCESAVFDKHNNIIYASLIGNREAGDGSIATINLDGEIINKTFISGLNDPKGIAITTDKLYVSDVTDLVEADLKTGKVIKKYTLPSIAFLNDVAIDRNGNIFVSDTRTSEIYKLDTNGNLSLWLANSILDNPNGLLVDDNTMYIASWGSDPKGGRLSKVDMANKKVDTISSIIGNLDGIRPFDANQFIISDWNSGNIHLINTNNGETEKLLTVGQSVGDIAYIKEKDLLLLPMNKQSRLLFYKIK